MSTSGPEDVGWERLDKQKFYVYGAGLFSGVTLLLFPASVIKTRQMASNDIPAGLQGVKQTAQTIWRTDGLPGFYRGLSTVVFGTIPARVVYLSALELVKSSSTKVCQSMDWSEPATAAMSNFLGGASASLATQLVTVPVDVVSQRQMMHSAEPLRTKPPSHAGPAPSAPAPLNHFTPSPSNVTPAPSSNLNSGTSSNPTPTPSSTSTLKPSSKGTSGSLSGSTAFSSPNNPTPKPVSKLTSTPSYNSTPASSILTLKQSSFSTPLLSSKSTALPSSTAQAPRSCTSTSSMPLPHRARLPTTLQHPIPDVPNNWSHLQGHQQHPWNMSATSTAIPRNGLSTAASAVTTFRSCPHTSLSSMPRKSLAQYHRCTAASFLAVSPTVLQASIPSPHYVASTLSRQHAPVIPCNHTPSMPGFAAGLCRHPSHVSPISKIPHTAFAHPCSLSTSAPPLPLSQAASTARISGVAMVRLIVQQEGVRGLYRGFGASIATYAPSSAVWWGSYGLYQKLVWMLVDSCNTWSMPAPGTTPKTSSGMPVTPTAAPVMLAATSAAEKMLPKSGRQATTGGTLAIGTGSSGLSSARESNASAVRERHASDAESKPSTADMFVAQALNRTGSAVVVVQTVAALVAGLTSAAMTNPLDLIKTRLQVTRKEHGVPLTFLSVAGQLLKNEGVKGLWRGVAPRMLSSAMWGTAMVTTYEFLKRICRMPEDEVQQGTPPVEAILQS